MNFSYIAIIYNPHSTGDAERIAKDTAARLKKRFNNDTSVQLIATEYAGHAEEIAFETAMKHEKPLIISASGDGGYHEVINGAIKAQSEGRAPVCTVLPAGNANDHYSETRQTNLVETIEQQNVSKIDILEMTLQRSGKAQKRYAHSYIGLGLTPTVAAELNRHTLSAFREIIIVLSGFWHFKPFEIEIEGQKTLIDSLIISQIGRMAKVFNIEKSDLDDGVFEISLLPHGKKLNLLFKLIKAATRGVKPDRRASHYSFRVVKPMPIQLDGEVMQVKASDEITIKSAKQMLSTLL